MNGVQSVVVNPNVQMNGVKKPSAQEKKSNTGKYVGTTAGVVSGATGTYCLTKFINDNRDSVLGYVGKKLKLLSEKFPAVADEIKFFGEQGVEKLNEFVSKVKWGAGTGLIVVPTLVGLGVGAIVDFVRNKNKSSK